MEGSSCSSQSISLKRKSADVGWEFGELACPNNWDKIKCKLCGKIVSGGVNRLKQHVAGITGNVASCPKSTPIDKAKCAQALEEVKKKRNDKAKKLQEVRDGVNISRKDYELDDVVEVDDLGNIVPHSLGPMDEFVRAIDPNASLEARKKTRQQNMSDAMFKSRTSKVHSYLARWVYESGIPFNAINNNAFLCFVESVGIFGRGYVPPSQYMLREPLLKQEVEKTRDSMKLQEIEWKKNGCSVMTDAWTDRKRRSIMNLCVNCKASTIFLGSVESSSEAHTGKYIFEFVDKHIEEIRPNNVIQVVTDNACKTPKTKEAKHFLDIMCYPHYQPYS